MVEVYPDAQGVEAKLQSLQMGMVYLQEIGDVKGLEELGREYRCLLDDPLFQHQTEQISKHLNHLQSLPR